MIAGFSPIVLGTVNIKFTEFISYLYLPVKMGNSEIRLPKNLEPLRETINFCLEFQELKNFEYIYITAKKRFFDKEVRLNRNGLHTDGFGSNDRSVIWSDKIPTEFFLQEFNLSNDHCKSIIEMEEQAKIENMVTYPNKTLLLLDEKVVHRVQSEHDSCTRSFVKIAFSNEKYNLRGNSHNELFDYSWEMYERKPYRNHPISGSD